MFPGIPCVILSIPFLCAHLPHSPIKAPLFPFIFPFPFKSPVACYSLVCFFYLPFPWSPFTFLVSAVTPGYTLTIEGLALETLDKKEYATFVFLGLVISFNMVFLSAIHLYAYSMISFFIPNRVT